MVIGHKRNKICNYYSCWHSHAEDPSYSIVVVGTTKTMDNPGIANAIRFNEQISKKSYISSFMYEYGPSLNQGVMNRPLFEDAELQLQ